MQHKHAGGHASDHSQRAGVQDAPAGHRMGAAAARVVEDGGVVAASTWHDPVVLVACLLPKIPLRRYVGGHAANGYSLLYLSLLLTP